MEVLNASIPMGNPTRLARTMKSPTEDVEVSIFVLRSPKSVATLSIRDCPQTIAPHNQPLVRWVGCKLPRTGHGWWLDFGLVGDGDELPRGVHRHLNLRRRLES